MAFNFGLRKLGFAGDLTQFLKPNCVSCGKQIEMTTTRYIKFGNYCEECDLQAWKDAMSNSPIAKFKEQRREKLKNLIIKGLSNREIHAILGYSLYHIRQQRKIWK
jgi:endogenous inhibitor of DNA gyrase (YacG/DUF329 family)